jgi:group I intron endonuclease
LGVRHNIRGRVSGIYKISSPSGKCYIGSSVDIKKRATRHGSELRNGRHPNIKLQSAYDKYGRLSLEPIYRCKAEDLQKWEQVFIDQIEPSYNILKMAYSSIGYKHTPEALEKIRENNAKYDYKWLKKHHFKAGGKNPMKKGMFAPCHLANSTRVLAKKEGCKDKVFRSICSCSRFFNCSDSTIHVRLKGKVSKPLKGWTFEFAD